MLYSSQIACRFFENIGFAEDELDPEADEGEPTAEVTQEMEDDFRKAVEQQPVAGHWGAIEWVEVSVGDDNEFYEDDVLIEYYFRRECTLTEQDVAVDADALEKSSEQFGEKSSEKPRKKSRVVLRPTDEALQRLKSEVKAHLGQHYGVGALTIEATAAKPKAAKPKVTKPKVT